ncbi:hypothetical protein PSAC2689_30155 [Paraburkholderia sacchari]
MFYVVRRVWKTVREPTEWKHPQFIFLLQFSGHVMETFPSRPYRFAPHIFYPTSRCI